VLSNQVIIAGLGTHCSTEGKTLLAHIQGHLLSAENLFTMVKSFHTNSQSKQYVNPSSFNKDAMPKTHPLFSPKRKERTQRLSSPW